MSDPEVLPEIKQIIGAMIFQRFSLNEAEHSEIRKALDERDQPT